jgi:hypothetical protein
LLPQDNLRAAEAKRRLAGFYVGDRDHDAESEALLHEVLDTCDRLRAGARVLLVSHWAVNSEAAVAIATGAFDAQSAEPAIGRAEALRRSILALIARGGVNAHPAIWAPFILVGDGT